MRNPRTYVFAALCGAGLLIAACTESNFAGSSGNTNKTNAGTSTGDSSDTPGTGSGSGSGTGSIAGDCVDGDKVNFEFGNEEIQKCIDDGKMWNFDSNQCTKMKKSSFGCNFDEFFAQMEKRGMEPSSLLLEGKEKQALIVGCGESDDGETILLQWFFKPEGYKTECKVDKLPGNIITGCYGKDGKDPTGLSEAQRKVVVLECMNKNAA